MNLAFNPRSFLTAECYRGTLILSIYIRAERSSHDSNTRPSGANKYDQTSGTHIAGLPTSWPTQ